jgi:hypothetical protein
MLARELKLLPAGAGCRSAVARASACQWSLQEPHHAACKSSLATARLLGRITRQQFKTICLRPKVAPLELLAWSDGRLHERLIR